MRRKEPGEFPRHTVELLQTFAAQSVLAIQNANLFAEVEEKSRQLEIASQPQVAVPRQHEPRATHPAQRHHRADRDDGQQCAALRTEKAAEPLRRVHRAGTHLLGLINQVLDLSRSKPASSSLARSRELAPLVDECSARAPAGGAERESLVVEARRSRPVMVDPMRLRQILLNLLSNACKFTKNGEVALRAQAGSTANWIEFAVARYGHRHDGRTAGEAVRGIHPGRFLHRPALRRHRPRPRHHPQACPHDGRRRDRDPANRARALSSPSACRAAELTVPAAQSGCSAANADCVLSSTTMPPRANSSPITSKRKGFRCNRGGRIGGAQTRQGTAADRDRSTL